MILFKKINFQTPKLGTCSALVERTCAKSDLNQTSHGSQFQIKIVSPEEKQACCDILVECSNIILNILEKNTDSKMLNDENQNHGFLEAKALLERFKEAGDRNISTESYLRAEFQTNEGALENVKPTYSGDVGSQIRKLLSENVIQRNNVGLLHEGSEKFLLVLHDKNRLSLLALSSLLSKKSAGASMAVSRQSTTNISFSIMSMAVSGK